MVPSARRLSADELERLRALFEDNEPDAWSESEYRFVLLDGAVERLIDELAELRARVGDYDPPASWHVVSAPTHEAWLKAREGYLTASDMPAVLGMSPYKSRAQVVRDKAFPKPERIGSREMQMGQFLEDGVIRAFGHFTGRKVARLRTAGGVSMLVAHPTIPGLAASLDGVELDAHDNPVAAIECKVTSGNVFGYNWTPALVQLQVQMSCVGLDNGHVVADAGSKITWKEDVKVKHGMRSRFEDVVGAFWDDVESMRASG